jgi:hypothetical protein
MAVFHAIGLNSLFRNARLLRIKITVFWVEMPCSPVDSHKFCKNSFMYLCLGHWITICKPWVLRNWDLKHFLKMAFMLAFVHVDMFQCMFQARNTAHDSTVITIKDFYSWNPKYWSNTNLYLCNTLLSSTFNPISEWSDGYFVQATIFQHGQIRTWCNTNVVLPCRFHFSH